MVAKMNPYSGIGYVGYGHNLAKFRQRTGDLKTEILVTVNIKISGSGYVAHRR